MSTEVKGFKRINFFKGFLTTEHDWNAAEKYHIDKRALHNRVLHSPGVVFGYALLILAPFVWIALSSFKSQIQILTNAMVFEPVLDNYIELLFSKSASFHRNIANSLVVIPAPGTGAVLALGLLGAARRRR